MATMQKTLKALREAHDDHLRLFTLFQQFAALVQKVLANSEGHRPAVDGVHIPKPSSDKTFVLTYLGRDIEFAFRSRANDRGWLAGLVTVSILLSGPSPARVPVDQFMFDVDGVTNQEDTDDGGSMIPLCTDDGAVLLVIDMLEKSLKL